jgi:hypothetical protein
VVGGPTLAETCAGNAGYVGPVLGVGASGTSARMFIFHGYQTPRNHLLAHQGELGWVHT